MRAFLPSIKALRALDAAARHGNFTHAANELGVTQTAISHQIKILEDQFGVRFFVRDGNKLSLTDTAKNYIAAVQAAIGTLTDATEGLLQKEQENVLTICAFAAFAMKWLIPNIHLFQKEYPEIKLRISARALFEHQFDPNLHDLDIRAGHGDWPGMRVDPLFPEVIFPVCSPALTRGSERLSSASELHRVPIIWSGASFLLRNDWPTWARAAKINIDLPADLIFEHSLPAIEAAINGLGVVIGRQGFVEGDLASGRLVNPFGPKVLTGAHYYLLTPIGNDRKRKVKVFSAVAA